MSSVSWGESSMRRPSAPWISPVWLRPYLGSVQEATGSFPPCCRPAAVLPSLRHTSAASQGERHNCLACSQPARLETGRQTHRQTDTCWTTSPPHPPAGREMQPTMIMTIKRRGTTYYAAQHAGRASKWSSRDPGLHIPIFAWRQLKLGSNFGSQRPYVCPQEVRTNQTAEPQHPARQHTPAPGHSNNTPQQQQQQHYGTASSTTLGTQINRAHHGSAQHTCMAARGRAYGMQVPDHSR